jgi:outer membrane protein assembly factor BamD (BamD/ComL family)
MKKLATIMLCSLFLNACVTMNKGESVFNYRSYQEKKLASAIKLQSEGKIPQAIESFKAICSERGLHGVTDEALFRQSFLYLGFGLESDREFIQLAQQNMERLRKEYPVSPWTRMAEPVADLLANAAELRRQNSNLRSHNQTLSKDNQALSKDNQELKESIEKLKRLDLELDKNRK